MPRSISSAKYISVKMAGHGQQDLAMQAYHLAYDAMMDVYQEPLRTVIHNKVASSLVHLHDFHNAIGMVYLHDKNSSLLDGLKELSAEFLKAGNHKLAFETAFMALVNKYLDKLMDCPIEEALA